MRKQNWRGFRGFPQMIRRFGEEKLEAKGFGQHQTDFGVAPTTSGRILEEYHDALKEEVKARRFRREIA